MAAAGRSNPGPVQLDLSFREPLLGDVLELPDPIDPPNLGDPMSPAASAISDVVDKLDPGPHVL